MNCPHCNFEFKRFAVNGDKFPDVAPIVCESCCEVSLVENGSIRVLTPDELVAIKASPAWADFIAPMLEVLHAEKAKRS